MEQLNGGSEARAKESLEETMKVRAVEVAYQLLWNHPNWLRGYGFTVHESQWPEFLESMGQLKQEVRNVVEWETYNEQDLPRRPTPPDYFEVISIAVHFLLTNQKPVRPLPLLVGRTFEAMGRFYQKENPAWLDRVKVEVDRILGGDAEARDGVDAGEWSVDDVMAEGVRTVH